MNRILAGLIVFAVIAGIVIGWGSGLFGTYSAPDVRAAIAEQEQAKARRLQADAFTAEATAASAWADAEARRRAVDALEQSIRLGAIGSGLAVAIVAVGFALAGVTWANVRARVVYPKDGVYPIFIERRLNGSLVIADASRQLSPVVAVDYGGTARQALEPDVQTAARLATNAQAAAVMASAFTRRPADEVAERVRAADVPVPVFARDVAGSDDGGTKFVYVKSRTPDGNSKSARELSDIGEFIRTGWGPRGLSRRAWLGMTFAGSGNKVTRGYYDIITGRLERAGVISQDANAGGGWRPAVELPEALDAFGLAHDDAAEDV